jgi:hypothetical protein
VGRKAESKNAESHVLLVLVSLRKSVAPRVQKVLTAWGCFIKTRLGLHQGTLKDCTETGLIFLELVGDKKKHLELARKLNLLPGVEAKLVTLKLP